MVITSGKGRWEEVEEGKGGIKKRKILPLATAWMDLEDIMLSEISQSEKNK